MHSNWTESTEQIARRKARILAGLDLLDLDARLARLQQNSARLAVKIAREQAAHAAEARKIAQLQEMQRKLAQTLEVQR